MPAKPWKPADPHKLLDDLDKRAKFEVGIHLTVMETALVAKSLKFYLEKGKP